MARTKRILQTVNVIEISSRENMNIDRFWAFPDDDIGNDDAEAVFEGLLKKALKPDQLDQEDFQETLNDCLEEGYYETNQGGIYITHSTETIKSK